MKIIEPAEENVFKLIFSKGHSNKIFAEKTGRININNNSIVLDYKNNTDVIGWIENSLVIIRTLHRNLLPLYVRIVREEVWLSNDVAELLIQGEVVSVRRVEILFAAAGSEAIRSAFSHLIEDINLLMPSSRYQISFEEGHPSVAWSDIDFEFRENATKEGFLDFFIEQYNKVYSQDSEICLAISGGYDSRLDLAILSHLKKKVHCYHYITSKYETEQARLVAQIVGESFCALASEQLVLPGGDFLKQKGYLTRWDGFFAAGTLYSVGLYLEMLKDYPTNSKLLMGFGELRGRLYEQSDNILDYWINAEEHEFNKCVRIFPNDNHLIRSEVEHRKKLIPDIIYSLQQKCSRNDIAMDIAFGMLSRQGKLAARSTFLFENGMPFFSIKKEVREYFMSLPQKDKEQDLLLEWAIRKLNPELNSIPMVTSLMSYAEREFGIFGRVPILGGLLNRFTKINKGYSQDWYQDTDVVEIFELMPEIKDISKHASGDKQRLYIAQICRFLKAIYEKKKVTFRITE